MTSYRAFLSYRRGDSIGHTGRLHDRLVARWGHDCVFWDIDNIAPGEDFVEAIDQTLGRCDVVLVVIGPRWMDLRDSEGRRRIDSAADFHRLEIERALSLKVRVVPILVDGAVVPAGEMLPESIRGLVRRNAFEITDKRFDYDTTKLVDSIEHVLAASRTVTEPMHEQVAPPAPSVGLGKADGKRYVFAIAGLIVISIVAVGLYQQFPGHKPKPPAAITIPSAASSAMPNASPASETTENILVPKYGYSIYGGFFTTKEAAQARANEITKALSSRKTAEVFDTGQTDQNFRYLVGIGGFKSRDEAAAALKLLMARSLTTDPEIRAIQ
jgi:hypothetical protein